MATDFVTAEEKTLMTDDFNDFISDEQVGVSITYKAFVSKSAFVPGTGKVTETYTNSTINAFRVPIDQQEIAQSGERYQAGDYRYMIRVADIATPKKDDRITDGAITRYPYEWGTDPLRIYHVITARTLGG